MAKTYRPKRTDPAVRLSPERLRAAIQYKELVLQVRRLSVRAIAEAVVPGRAASFRVRLQSACNLQGGEWGACSRAEREALAMYIGEPITAAWLGAEEDIEWDWFPGYGQEDMNRRALPGTPWDDAREDFRELVRLTKAAERAMPQDGAGRLNSSLLKHIGRRVRKTSRKRKRTRVRTSQPPLYQLITWRLAREVESAWRAGHPPKGREGLLYPGPPMLIFLSLAFWRRLLFEHEVSVGSTTDARGRSKEAPARRIAGIVATDETEANEFAAAVSAAVRILLRPWLDGGEEIPDARIKLLLSLIRNLGTMKPSDVDRDARRWERSVRSRTGAPSGRRPTSG